MEGDYADVYSEVLGRVAMVFWSKGWLGFADNGRHELKSFWTQSRPSDSAILYEIVSISTV